MVKILIGNISSKIIGYLPDDVQTQLDKVLSYTVKDAHYLISVRKKRWDGIYHLYKRHSGQSFYTGLLSLAEAVLKANNIPFIRVDERIKPPQNLPNLIFTPTEKYEERDYQAFTIDRALKKTRGVLKMATGAGKTVTTIKLISQIKTYPFMFYVLTEDLMNQAYEELTANLNEPIGRIGGGEFDIKKINVCTIQTAIRALNIGNKSFKISDYKFDEEDAWDEKQIEDIDKMQQLKNLIGAAKGLYFDEAHHASAKTVKDVLSASPFAYWRYGGSATPFREDGAEIMIQALFGQKIVDISASYLIDRGYLIKPYIFFDPIAHDCKLHSYQSIYKECISQNKEFNNRVVNLARFFMSKKLNVLILVQQYVQGEMIQKQLPELEFVTGKMKRVLRKEALNKVKNGEKMGVIGTTLYDEGVDCPCLDVVIMAGGGASATRVYQRIGRALRKHGNKDKAAVIYFQHQVKHLEKHAKKAKKIMKMEPSFEIIDSAGKDFLFNEINEIFKFDSNNESIMDI